MSRIIPVALWGYGQFGKDIEQILTDNWPDLYRITAVYDRDHARLNAAGCGQTLRDPETIGTDHKNGLFDSVIITLYDEGQRRAVAAHLAALSVPVLQLDTSGLYRDPDSFEQVPFPLSVRQEGYAFYAYPAMFLSMEKRMRIPFLHDRSGHINRAYWVNYQMQTYPAARYFRPVIKEPAVYLPGTWCLLEKADSQNYWHFTFEVMDQIWLLEKAGFDGRYILPETAFSGELLSLLGLAPERVVRLEDLDVQKTYRFEMLLCTELLHDNRACSAPVLLDLAQHILSRIPDDHKTYPKRIFIRRTGIRKLLIPEQFLAKYGFAEVIPETLSVSDQIRYFRDAEIVFSPHGANSTNSLYMRPGSVFIETFPTGYTNPCCLETLAAAGVYYLPVTETVSGTGYGTDAFNKDYALPESLLETVMRNALILSETGLSASAAGRILP